MTREEFENAKKQNQTIKIDEFSSIEFESFIDPISEEMRYMNQVKAKFNCGKFKYERIIESSRFDLIAIEIATFIENSFEKVKYNSVHKMLENAFKK